MLIAARNGFASKRRWKNPYPTDGLIAMWDGEWNAGGGKHDPNTTEIIDLVGNCNLNIIGSVEIGDNYFMPSTNGSDDMRSSNPLQGTVRSFDIVLTNSQGNAGDGKCGIVSFGQNNRGILKYVEWFGAGVDGTYRMSQYGNVVKTLLYSVNYNSDSNNTDILQIFNGVRWTGTTLNWNSKGFDDVAGTENLVRIQRALPIGNAKIFNIRVFSRTRTLDEIAAYYAIDKTRFSVP